LSVDDNLDNHSPLPHPIRTVEPQNEDEQTTFVVERVNRSVLIDAETAPIRNRTGVRDSKVSLQVVAPPTHVEQIRVPALQVQPL
jgi:hypothetical protein